MKILTFITAFCSLTALSAQTKTEAELNKLSGQMAQTFCECTGLSKLLDVHAEQFSGKISEEVANSRIATFELELKPCMEKLEKINEGLTEPDQQAMYFRMRTKVRQICPKIADKFDKIEQGLPQK